MQNVYWRRRICMNDGVIHTARQNVRIDSECHVI